MKVVKAGRKWAIEGQGEGWIFDKKFPTKWKAEIALGVFKKGGKVSEYWREAKEASEKRPKVAPWRVTEELEKALEEIKQLDPTCDEIKEYGECVEHGVVTLTESEECFKPQLHDTWGMKVGGRVHIDIGCGGYHLMLDKKRAKDFIRFIKEKRA